MSFDFRWFPRAAWEGFSEPFRMLHNSPLIIVCISGLLCFMAAPTAIYSFLVIASVIVFGLPARLAHIWAQFLMFSAINLAFSVASFWVMRTYWRNAKIKHPSLFAPRK